MAKPIKRLLIANRGEIACRIARTAHAMGIETVAIASRIEVGARHTRACDHAVRIGEAAAADSYLSIDRVLAAAIASGADAVHPGYGFLAENAAFARAVIGAGLVFVGPSPEAIDALGSKLRAGELAAAVGIEPIPRFARGSTPSRFPVMVKPADGGGGKGMAIVRAAADLEAAIESATRVARASLGLTGSTDLIIEEYIEGARHIEVQILADSHGNVVHLGERECSIQRRHQKVIEEAPAVGLPATVRDEMTKAAVALAVKVGYVSAGTVEMILSPDGRFFFLEVNTRLQVEHAVTEMTTGIDIVAEQLRIASGKPLSFAQRDVRATGVAIEARLYAEDPAAGDLPATGVIVSLSEPSGEDLRVDSGLSAGQTIGIDYDPMLAKLIARGDDREQARARLARALAELTVLGVATNRAALRRALALEAFADGALDTEFWSRHHDALVAGDPREAAWAAIAAVLAGVLARGAERGVEIAAGFRLGGPAEATEHLEARSESWTVHYTALGADAFRVRVASGAGDIDETVKAERVGGAVTLWRESGQRMVFQIGGQVGGSDTGATFVASRDDDFAFVRPPRFGDPSASQSSGDCTAPMPGRVVAVHVSVGDVVSEGQTLLVLEAMKMEHALLAPHAGEVTEIAAQAGDQVDAGLVLAVVLPTE